jgi:hypothetical protein
MEGIVVSVTPLKLVEPSTPAPPAPSSAPPAGRVNVGKLTGILVAATVGLLTTLIVGIVIGSAARKRFEKWNRGY